MLEGKIRARTFVPPKNTNRRSASLVHDGKDYYKNYDNNQDDIYDQNQMMENDMEEDEED